MAKDVPAYKATSSSSSSLSSSSGNNSGNTSPTPNADQQKVPPLRIVLNTSGNQKSAYNTISTSSQQSGRSQDSQSQQPKNQDSKVEFTAQKPTGKVRIRLGSSRQQSAKNNSNNGNEGPNSDDSQKLKNIPTTSNNERQDTSTKEENIANYGHLRRITRRSQRAHMINNEDEESRTSMTSNDENHTSSQINPDNGSSQDGSSQQVSNIGNSAATNSTGTSDTPRRYKRRKCEVPESQPSELESPFKHQNYRPPHQNSFELFKSIRKQIDDKLKNLNIVHPKTPFGFRDYMLTRGAYLLDGNKLGNGVNLFMNEDGGIYPAPISKYHALRNRDKVNYSVPNRAKVPLGLPVSSPLYNLFIEQEKERYKMRIQHLKEREKLTLAAEQEIVRVYNQAALDEANQIESLSVCTLLKHQEIYNSLDSDTQADPTTEEMDQEQAKQERVRTRRRNQSNSEQISPEQSRKNSTVEETSTQEDSTQRSKNSPNADESKLDDHPNITNTSEAKPDAVKMGDSAYDTTVAMDVDRKVGGENASSGSSNRIDYKNSDAKTHVLDDSKRGNQSTLGNEESKISDEQPKDSSDSELMKGETKINDKMAVVGDNKHNDKDSEINAANSEIIDQRDNVDKNDTAKVLQNDLVSDSKIEHDTNKTNIGKDGDEIIDDKDSKSPKPDVSQSATAEIDKQAQNKEVFLNRLQEIDDKWDQIRNEMLIRHRNEAESLHAVQKLEWEWKTKEIGLCDVRTTPMIDISLVPKLEIHTQDY